MIEGKEIKSDGFLRYGMVGGGQGAFIGDVHRRAISLDGKAQLVAGSFSHDFDNTLKTGKILGLKEERLYRDFNEMAEAEANRDDGIDFVSIVTPNHLHYSVARAFLEQGINVVCDKPLTVELKQAEELNRLAREKDLLFAVTYAYSGYPMVKQAREMIRRGDMGEIRMVMAEYPQEWLATPAENSDNKQAAWRTNPEMTGKSNCVGDIGSHIEHTVSYMTGLEIESLCANLDIFVAGRVLDDNAGIMLKYRNGARGIYWSSQIAIGHDNDLKIRVFGSKGSLEWSQEDPNYLKVAYLNKPVQILSRGRDKLYPLAEEMIRIPAGHPEGYFEAFANIYSNYTTALMAKKAGKGLTEIERDFPEVSEGMQGVRFISRVVESSDNGAVWVDF